VGKIVYLCGPINGCSGDEAHGWRGAVREQLRNERVEFNDPMDRDYRGREGECVREIVEMDKLDIRKSDVLLVMYVKPSVGTSMEVFFAWALGIPVIVVDLSRKPMSPWLAYHATEVFQSISAACARLAEMSRQ
jgi:nucleoside 2-deoxyribosyltransferase